MKKKLLLFTLFLFGWFFSYSQTLPGDVNFILLSSKKKTFKDTLFINPDDSVALKKFYKAYDAVTLPAHLKSGQLFFDAPCGSVLALCINIAKHSKLEFKTKLKSSNGDNPEAILIDNLKTNAVSKWKKKEIPNGDHILIINLTEYLTSFYKEKNNEKMECCPEEYIRDARKEALQKVCQLYGIYEGLTINIFTDTIKTTYTNWQHSGVDFKRSQPDEPRVPQIDPRKYLLIEEHKKKKGAVDTVWNNFIQERNILDSRSDVIIRFKQDSLKKELAFKGNISLMAQINDSDPIEIPPYSVIGENFSTVGTTSLSPNEFALSFVSEMMNIYETTQDSSFIRLDKCLKNGYYNSNLISWLDSSTNLKTLVATINRHLNKRDSINIKNLRKDVKLYRADKIFLQQNFQETLTQSGLDKKLDWYVNLLSADIDTLIKKIPDSLIAYKNNAKSISSYFKSIQETRLPHDFFLNQRDSIAIGIHLKQFFKSISQLDVLNSFYAQMNTERAITITELKDLITILSGSSTSSTAISNFIDVDYIQNADYALRQLKMRKNYFHIFLKRDEATLFAILTEIHRDSLFLAHALESIDDNLNKLIVIRENLSTIRNILTAGNTITPTARTKTEEYISQFTIQMRRFTKTMNDLRKVEQDEFNEAKRTYLATSKNHYIENKHEFAKIWANELASKAAKQLYKKLIIGKIDLTKRAIDDNSKLTIYVLWYDEPGKPPKKLQVASFILRKLGWNEQIVDSFLLVNQVSAPDSASRFKGAAGVSLMWSYTAGERGDFFQRLQPSIGLNVSYLDFDSTQSFEVGVGALVGLWKNKVFIGYGKNLHVKEGANYFSLGFSFAKIAESWNNKQSSNQGNP